MDNLTTIAQFVQQQFPEFYKSNGQNFIQFIKAYFEWEDQRSKLRELVDYRDIDTTLDEFLIHFRHEYMSQVPRDILGDKRLLQKHILDLYRAKGSQEGIRLIFRLLFNEEIELYLPAVDIFKLDESVFLEPKYMEISKMDGNNLFDGKQIRGVTSGATAIVEHYENRYVKGMLIDILFLSNIKGTFLPHEYVTYDGLKPAKRPYILGSPVSLEVISSDANFIDGEALHVVSNEEAGLYLTGIVDTLKNNSTGIIVFTLVDGGYGYSLSDTVVQITSGANTSGAGADFEITAIGGDIDSELLSRLRCADYTGVHLNANNYAYGPGDTSNMRFSDINAILQDALEYEIVEFGTITEIATLSPGAGYDGNVTIHVYDPLYLGLNKGDYPNGNNAVIDNQAVNGSGFVDTLKVKNSGFGYHTNGEIINMNSNNDLRKVTTKIILGGVGTQDGYWKDTTSFVDSDKYLQDDYYYQEFSYEVQVNKMLDEYKNILIKTVHPTGNQLFGKVKLISEG